MLNDQKQHKNISTVAHLSIRSNGTGAFTISIHLLDIKHINPFS